MPELNLAEYYRTREREERALAEAAVSAAVASIHRQMADRYGELTSQADPKPGLR